MCALICLSLLLAWCLPQPAARADDDAHAASSLADPIVAVDAELTARRVTSWRENGVLMLLLEGDAKVAMGAYAFRADRAVVRIDEETSSGVRVRHLAMYLDNARTMQGRGPTQAQAPRLLVTASTTGQVDLSTDLLRQTPMAGHPLVIDATERIGKYLDTLKKPVLDVPAGPPMTVRTPAVTTAAPRAPLPPKVVRRLKPVLGATGLPAARASTEPQQPEEPVGPIDPGKVLPTAGVVSFSVDKAVFRKAENVLVLLGNVNVVYHGTSNREGVSLSAQNAVIFLQDDVPAMPGAQLNAELVKGVYLEDNVIARYADYTVRAPRVFYDLESDRAVVLDAVMYTWDVKRRVPIYVRAEKLMQRSLAAWEADRAILTTSEFAEPHFAIAANQVTIARSVRPDGSVSRRFVSHDNTLRWGKAPVFYWPRLSGEIQELPIRRLDGSYDGNDGPIVRSEWDVFALAGREKPEGVDLSAKLDFLGDRGAAIGGRLDYDRTEMLGRLDGYLVANDDAQDQIADRTPIDHDGDARGYVKWQHRQYLDDGWEASAELSYVSDETFLEEFFRNEAETAKPYETSLYLLKQERDWALTFLASRDLNDFVAQTSMLQSPGYSVDKLPEVGYWRIGTTLWNDRLTYYSQNHASRMRIRPGEDMPSDRGFNAARSMLLFGIPHTLPFDDAAVAAGIEDGYVNRFDTRHELQAPMKVSILDVVPYLAGRITAYNEDTLTMGEHDNIRYWGAAGARLHTQFSRTYDKAASGLFDVHRLRHIVEPSLDVFISDASLDWADLAVFDPDVEGINQGWGVILGLRNTLQTQRGGQGRWRTVDWLVLDTDIVWRGDEEPHNRVIPRYFGYRPEYSLGGDHVNAEMMWMISDTLATVAELTYHLEDDMMSQWRIGVNLDHSPQLALFADFAEIDELSSRLLTYGFDYRLTSKYTARFNHRLDLSASGDRSIDVALIRKLPRWKLIFLATVDELDDNHTFGIVLVPDGIGGSRYNRALSTQSIF